MSAKILLNPQSSCLHFEIQDPKILIKVISKLACGVLANQHDHWFGRKVGIAESW